MQLWKCAHWAGVRSPGSQVRVMCANPCGYPQDHSDRNLTLSHRVNTSSAQAFLFLFIQQVSFSLSFVVSAFSAQIIFQYIN